jgi:SAM-dependent methyltransferase
MAQLRTQLDLSSSSSRRSFGKALDLSVIVPVYNERHLVETSLRRLLAVTDPIVRSLQIIVVDDHSTDGTYQILERLQADGDPRLMLVRHETNSGKGAAIRTGLRYAKGDVTVIHDADLEYNPQDLPALLRPFVEEGADAVFGSRYLAAPYRRALMYRHSLMNRWLTTLANVFTDLYLTDVETCYKAVRTALLQSIPLRSNDFRIEIELTMKLAKRRAHIFEVPIRYLPRSYREGKKIRSRDGLHAVGAFLRFSVVDDLYHDDEYGSHILHQLERTHRFNTWMADVLRPFLGDRVLEIGSGIGNLTSQFIPRDVYVASDINPSYLHFLESYALGKPYLHVLNIDATRPDDFAGLERHFDTVVIVNVLEHVADEQLTLANLKGVLEKDGRLVILVPQHPALYSTLDEVLGHRERYTPEKLKDSVEKAGLVLERMFDFNRASVPGWFINGKLLKRKAFSRVQLKIFDTAVPVLRRIDRLWPYTGQSLIAVARRPD